MFKRYPVHNSSLKDIYKNYGWCYASVTYATLDVKTSNLRNYISMPVTTKYGILREVAYFFYLGNPKGMIWRQ
jgi:hypothetical protein